MPELSALAPTPRLRDRSVRLVGLAEAQWGVVTRQQLEESGLPGTAITRWLQTSRLHRLYPGVYALGHRRIGAEGKLAAALFYAGPGAMLSHLTAAWWSRIVGEPVRETHVSAPGDRRPLAGVCVHHPRHLRRVWHGGFPVTPPAQTLLDIAGVVRLSQLRRALAEAEYLRLLTLDDVKAVLGRGRPGSPALRAALECHRPELAQTKSMLEEKFLLLCERHSLPRPAVNAGVAGWLVDAVWFDARLVAELDRHAAHGTPSRLEQDHRRDLDLRAAGYTVLRYTWQQVTHEPERVVSDLRRSCAARA